MTLTPWPAAITAACADPDPIRANRTITLLHYQLSQALAHHLPGGPNFHTWAVWGSRKAGVTLRQETSAPPSATPPRPTPK